MRSRRFGSTQGEDISHARWQREQAAAREAAREAALTPLEKHERAVKAWEDRIAWVNDNAALFDADELAAERAKPKPSLG